MHKKFLKRKKEHSVSTRNIIGILFASSIGFSLIILLTFFVSVILAKSLSLTNSMSIYYIGSIVIGALITGFVASKKCEFKGVFSGVLASIPLIFLITVLMLIFSHCRLVPETMILYLGIIILSAIGGIISANTRRRK